MSQIAYPAEDRELIGQIVAAPAIQRILALPTFAWQEIGMVAGVYVALILSTTLALSGNLPLWAAMTINAIAIYAAFTPFHDAAHSSVSRDRRINDGIGTISVLPLFPGFTTGLYRFLHLEHHRHTGEGSRDPDDVMVSAPILTRLLSWVFIDVYWTWWYLKRWRERSTGQLIRDGLGAALFVAVHLGFLLSPYAWEFVLLWLIPQRVGITFLTYMFAAIQHPHGVVQAQHPIQGTRMIRGGALVRIAFISQSQHLMHHLFPGVPYYRYNAAWKASQALLSQQEIVWSWPVGALAMPTAGARRAGSTLPARIVGIEAVSSEVNAYLLESCSTTALPAFAAGAHIDLHIAPGLIRQYSLCSGPRADGRYRIAIKREDGGRGGSLAAHRSLKRGDEVQISTPRNLFPLVDNASSVILVSGGIGITPLMSMAETLAARGTPFVFHACARSQSALPFSSELSSATYAAQICTHLDDGAAAQKLGAADLAPWQPGMALYLCGPQGFMRHVQDMAKARGWPEDAIHTESFAAPVHDASKNRAFEIVLRTSGQRITVPADRTLLDVLQENRIPAAVAVCTQGLCGSCVLRVCEGEVEHRDVVLGAQDRRAGFMTACVSRAAGERLILDL